MKKIITILCLGALSSTAYAGAPTKEITGNITGTRNLVNDTIYILKGKVYVKSGATLNIASGTVIKGDAATPGSALIVTRGAKINAIGTPTQPIVFTSSKAAGSRSAGDWGGLVIAGNAKNNIAGGIGIFEGGNLANPDGTNSDGEYGGLNDLDNSGSLKYVRIEFAGFAYQPNNELNALTLGSIGSGTTLDYIQCSYGFDDAFEFFGGTVNAKHLVAYRGNDDDFDTDFGYRGNLQYGLVLRDTAIADPVSGANGFESDNDGAGSGNMPYTAPVFSNFTLVGPRYTATTNYTGDHKRGAHVRRNSRLSCFNSIIMGFPTGIKIDGDSSHANADNGTLQFQNILIAGNKTNYDSTAGAPWNLNTWFNQPVNSNKVFVNNNSDVNLANPFAATAPSFIPTTISPALTGASFQNAKIKNTFFDSTSYIGAFGGLDWTTLWANWDPQNTVYDNGIFSVGIEKVATINFDLFPNPANTEVVINIPNTTETTTISIYSLTGKLVTTKTVNTAISAINTNNIAAGTYIVTVSSANGISNKLVQITH